MAVRRNEVPQQADQAAGVVVVVVAMFSVDMITGRVRGAMVLAALPRRAGVTVILAVGPVQAVSPAVPSSSHSPFLGAHLVIVLAWLQWDAPEAVVQCTSEWEAAIRNAWLRGLHDGWFHYVSPASPPTRRYVRRRPLPLTPISPRSSNR